MKNSLIIIFIALFSVACGGSERQTDKLLAEVWAKDQGVRRQMMELNKAVTIERREELIDSLVVVAESMEHIDAENMAVVDAILQQGLPEGLAVESYKTIWIVIDHAPLNRQVHYLPLIKQMATEGVIGMAEFATLYDRVAMKQNRPQRYGTQCVQFGTPESLQLFIWAVESPETLDSLRDSVGLGSIADYLLQLTTTMGIEAQYIPTLSVEELNELRNN